MSFVSSDQRQTATAAVAPTPLSRGAHRAAPRAKAAAAYTTQSSADSAPTHRRSAAALCR